MKRQLPVEMGFERRVGTFGIGTRGSTRNTGPAYRLWSYPGDYIRARVPDESWSNATAEAAEAIWRRAHTL